MAMTRYGLIPLIVPFNQRMPTGALGFAIPFHGSEEASPGFIPLTAVNSGTGAPAANQWSADPFAYTFPIDNGGTPKSCWNADPDLSDDSQLAVDLLDMPVGGEVIVAFSAVVPAEAPSSNALAFSYGNNAAGESLWGFGVSQTARNLMLTWRTAADSGVTVNTFFDVETGTQFSDAAYNNVKTWIAISVQLTGELTAKFRAAYSNGTQSGTGQRSITFNGSRPGRTGVDHKGVTIGARTDGSSYTNHFGRSGTTAASLGSFYARRWNDSDDDRLAAIVADMLARPNECPWTMLV